MIPLNENKKNLVDRIKEFRAKAKSNFGNIEQEDIRPDSELTIDELAARELLRGNKCIFISNNVSFLVLFSIGLHSI